MLKHSITFEDYEGDKITETLYFNITKTEMIELEVEHQDGLDKWLKTITKTNDRKTLFAEFKKIVLLAYGQKSQDGKRFIKNDVMREEFSQTAAFDALIMQLSTDAEISANFMKGIIPKDLAEQVDKNPEDRQINPALTTTETPNTPST